MTSELTSKTTNSETDEIDLGRLFGELIDYRKLIVSLTAGFTALAVLYTLLATPIYQANALIQVEQKQGNAILNSLSQMITGTQPQSEPEIALLQSRMILGKTVDDLNLQARVEQVYFPVIGRGLARLLGNKEGEINVSHLYIPTFNGEKPELKLTVIDNKNFSIDGNIGSVKGVVNEMLDYKGLALLVNSINANPGTTFKISYIPKLKAISNIQNVFSVLDQGKDTGMLNLTILDSEPDMASKILDSISQNYLAQNVERQAAQNAKSLDFLAQQLPKVRNDLDTAEGKLNNYRKEQDSVDLTMEAKTVLDQIVNVDNQLNQLTFKEAEISQLYTKEHPTYKALIEKRQTLQKEKERLNKKVSAMPSTQQEVLRLSRDVESGRAVYMQLLNRQQELNIAKSSAIGYVRIIDNAVTDPSPVKPKKIVIIIAGFVFGLFISIGIVLLKIFFRRGVESPEQLEEVGINIYASIPTSEWLTTEGKKLNKNKKSQEEILLAVENPADLAIEAIRSLRTSLHFAMLEAKNNILMISGASPNAGKTFVSSNLASVIAQTGKKVLFIDADMRKGYIHKVFGNPNKYGLSDILAGKASLNDVISNIPNAGFDFIPRGQIPPNPAELLMHPRCEELFRKISQLYDLIIVDTPPILAVTDAAIIGRYAGTALLVARFEQDTVKSITVSMKRFEQSGTVVKGCILNGIVKKASNYYGYGYNHYGYSYSDKK